jgi:hypothetical protein
MDWDDDLVNAIARRRAVVFIGAGVSRNSTNSAGKRPATWEQFLRDAANSIGNPTNVITLLEKKDFLTACEVLQKRIGVTKFRQRVQHEYQQAAYAPAKIHELIYRLDSSIVASPNFDSIYDTYAQGISNGSIVVKDHTSTDILNYVGGGDFRLLLKTHGTANAPGDVVFTRSEYAEARIKHRVFYQILTSLVLTHRFLFLGCGLDDPDIRMIFEDVRFAHTHMPAHCMTIPNNEIDEDLAAVISASMKIDFLQYDPADNHAELTSSLEALVDLVDTKRADLATSQKW